MPQQGKLEAALREFIVETIAESMNQIRGNESAIITEEEDDNRNRGRVTDPEHDRRLKENRGKAA